MSGKKKSKAKNNTLFSTQEPNTMIGLSSFDRLNTFQNNHPFSKLQNLEMRDKWKNIIAISKEVKLFFEPINTIIKNSFCSIMPQHKLPKSLELYFFSLKEKMKQFTERQKKNTEIFIKYDWYPIPNMNVTDNADENTIDQFMEQCINHNIDEIEKKLCNRHPDREKIIKDAFWAHKKGKYTLSIPAILTQADGICHKHLKISPFSKKKGMEVKDKIPKELSSTLLKYYLKPVITAESMRANSSMVSPSILNRHGIMHGTSTQYATYKNSLKAISYIASLDWLLQEREEHYS